MTESEYTNEQLIDFMYDVMDWRDVVDHPMIYAVIEALKERHAYRAIGTIEEFKAIKQWKSDIIESFSKYDVNSVDELMKRFRELTENNNRIIEILRTHRFTDEECIEKITEIVGIHSQN